MLFLCGCASQVSWQCIIINEAPISRRLALIQGSVAHPFVLLPPNTPQVDWQYIIIDEAQRMKDRQSKLARDLERFKGVCLLAWHDIVLGLARWAGLVPAGLP